MQEIESLIFGIYVSFIRRALMKSRVRENQNENLCSIL